MHKLLNNSCEFRNHQIRAYFISSGQNLIEKKMLSKSNQNNAKIFISIALISDIARYHRTTIITSRLYL